MWYDRFFLGLSLSWEFCTTYPTLIPISPPFFQSTPTSFLQATPGLNLTPDDFAWITAQVLSVARVCCPGRCVSVLEGGYGQWRYEKVATVQPPPSSGSSSSESASASSSSSVGGEAAGAAAAAAVSGSGDGSGGKGKPESCGDSVSTPNDTPTNAASSTGAAAAASAPTVTPPVPAFTLVPYLRRDNLGECCAAHLRTLIDDGAALDSEPLSANGMAGEG